MGSFISTVKKTEYEQYNSISINIKNEGNYMSFSMLSEDT